MAESISIVRVFKASASAVFRAWTDATLMQLWLAPDPCEVVEATADARLGGGYRIVVRDPHGNTHVTTGEYRELTPDTRIVATWVYEGPFHADRYPTLLTVDFRETGAGATEVTLRQDQLLTHEDREGNRQGWRLCFAKLDRLLDSISERGPTNL
jgi:glutathione S-transferase